MTQLISELCWLITSALVCIICQSNEISLNQNLHLTFTDDKLSLITCGACHLGYFLFAALAASFLGIPSFSRVTLLLIVAINAVMETQSGHSLDFSAISVFMVIICAGMLLLYYKRSFRGVIINVVLGGYTVFSLSVIL